MSHALAIQGTRHGIWFWTLWAAFGMRIVAQLLQHLHPVALLPGFDAWHSAILPYPALLTVQPTMVVALAGVAGRVSRGETRRRALLGKWLRRLGGLYLFVMLARLALGLTVLSGHIWFDKPVPTLFHLILATYLLVLAGYHSCTQGAPDAEKRI